MNGSPPARGNKLENGARRKGYGGMTDELSGDDDDQMGEGGPGMEDEEDDVELGIDPRSGRVDARPGGTARGQQRQRQQAPAYDDNEDF